MDERSSTIRALTMLINRAKESSVIRVACNDALVRTLEKAREELKRLIPVPTEIEGGGSTWFYVCGECHGQVDHRDSFCRHCGQKLDWGPSLYDAK